MADPDRIEWVPTSLCENPSISLPKEIVRALSKLVVMCEVIVVVVAVVVVLAVVVVVFIF